MRATRRPRARGGTPRGTPDARVARPPRPPQLVLRIAARLAVAALGVGALALAGCTPSGTSTSSSSPPPQLPPVGWTPVSGSQLRQGGTLDLAVTASGTDQGNWNIDTSQGAEADVVDMTAPLMGAPLKPTANGGVVVDPDYARSVTMTSTSPQTIRVVLNPKAVWQDGTPITAKDYRATYAAMSGRIPAFDVAHSAGFSDIATFTVNDPTEFTFTFATPYADWQAIVATPAVPAGIASSPTAWSTGFTAAPLPSSGPFVMSTVDNDARVYTETPNPRWWGAAPHLDKVVWTVMGDADAQAEAFVDGQVNAVAVSDADAYAAALKKPHAKAERSGGLTSSRLYFNGLRPPLNDVRVRKALAQAIDRRLIARTANEPFGAATVTDGNWIFVPGQNGYADTVGSTLPFDPDASTQLLTQAGWTDADGRWTKDGQQLQLSVIVPQGAKSNELRAQQIQASLKAIDVPVTLDEVPGAGYVADIKAGTYQMVTVAGQGSLFPLSSAQALLSPGPQADVAGQDHAWAADLKLDALWERAGAELDPVKRLAMANRINDDIAASLPFLPIAPEPDVYVVDGDLADYGPSTFPVVDWTQVGFTA